MFSKFQQYIYMRKVNWFYWKRNFY